MCAMILKWPSKDRRGESCSDEEEREMEEWRIGQGDG